MQRSEIDQKYKWNLSEIYPTEEDFDADCDLAMQLISKLPEHGQTMTESAEALAAACEDMYQVRYLISKLFEFAQRSFDLDTSNNQSQARAGKVAEIGNHFANATYYFTPKLLSIDDVTLKEWISGNETLYKYRNAIADEFRYKDHILSDAEEAILAQISAMRGSHDSIYSIFTDSDLRFGKIRGEDGKLTELTDSNYVPFLMSTDRRVRKAAFDKMYKVLSSYGNTFATIMQGFVKEQVTMAKIRKFDSAMDASTFSDNVPSSICNNLIDTVGENLTPLYRYYDLKKRMLGLSKLHLYDVYPPIVDTNSDKYDYEDAKKMVLEGLAPLGEEYVSTLREGMESGWIDVFPTRGKRGGAYSAGMKGTKPYILLNWEGMYDDVSTLAHESGHSMHTYYSCKNNEFCDSGYTIFVAEVPSTVNEILLAHDQLSRAKSNKEKLFVLNQLLEVFKGTLFRQTMFAEFERKIYALVEEGQTLTAELMCGEYYKIVRKYFGKDVVADKAIQNEWMRIPHFYYNFYVYKYATCISAAAAIVKRIESEGEGYVGDYLNFLSCGSSKTPLDSLKVAGIDLTDPQVIKDAIDMFSQTLDQFEAVLAEMEKEQ